MNQGNGNPIVALQTALQVFTTTPNAQVTPEEHRRNTAYIEHARQILDNMERENDEAYSRYIAVEHELRNRIQAGREAEQMLARLETRRRLALPTPTNTTAVPGSSTAWRGASNADTGSGGARIAEITDSPSSSAHGRVSTESAPSQAPVSYSASTTWYAGRVAHEQATHASQPAWNASAQQTQQHPAPHSYAYAPAPAAVYQYAGSQYVAPVGDPRYRYYNVQAPQPGQESTPMNNDAAPPTPSQQGRRPLQFVHVKNSTSASQSSSAAVPVSEANRVVHNGRTPVNVTSLAASGSTPLTGSSSKQMETKQQVDEVSSASVSMGAKQSAEAKQNAIRDIIVIMQGLTPKGVPIVNRLVINKLRDKMQTSGKQIIPPSMEGYEHLVTQETSVISDRVVDRLKNFAGSDIVTILRTVTALRSRVQSKAASSPSDPQQSVPAESASVAVSSSTAGPSATASRIGTSQQQVSAMPQAPPTAANIPCVPNFITPSQQAPQPHRTAREPSPMTPAKANRATLARDILRSLGRPSAEFLNAVSPALFATSSPEGSVTSQQGKRKRTASPPNGAGKKQKAAEFEPPSAATNPVTTKSPASEGASDSEVAKVLFAEGASSESAVAAGRATDALPGAMQLDVPPAEAPEEIHTPGAMELELEKVMASTSAPAHIPILSSPAITSVATIPPSSRSSTPGIDGKQPNVEILSLTSVQGDMQPHLHFDPSGVSTPNLVPPTSDATAASTQSEASSHPVTPIAGPSKQPLFFVSQSPESDIGLGDRDTADFIPSGLLGDAVPSPNNKGKQKVQYDSDSDIEIVDPPTQTPQKRRRKSSAGVEVDKSPVSKRKRLQPYILLTPPPRPDRRRSKAGASKRQVILVEDSDSPDEIAEDFVEADAEEKRRKAELVETLKLCVARINPTPCSWPGCDAVLLTGKLLQDHASTHAYDYEEDEPLICQWNNCTRVYHSVDRLRRHLWKHALHPVYCPLTGCNVACWGASEMARHIRLFPHRSDELKPAIEWKPKRPEPPPLPQTLPSYMSVSRQIRGHPISAQRHAELASKVAASISYAAPRRLPYDKARRTRRGRRLAERAATAAQPGIGPEGTSTRGRYDNWHELDPSYAGPPLDDLSSSYVTRLLSEGKLAIDGAYLRRGRPEEPTKEEEIEEIIVDAAGPVRHVHDEIEEFPEFVQGRAPRSEIEEIEDASTEELAEMSAMLVGDRAFALDFPPHDEVPGPPPPDVIADFDSWFIIPDDNAQV